MKGYHFVKFESVTIVISATDETISLKKTVNYIFDTCSVKDVGCILIVVPETVTDECSEIIKELYDDNPDVIKILVQSRADIGGALQDAVDYTETSHIMFFSADIPVELEVIPTFIKKAKEEPEHIWKVSRWLRKKSFSEYGCIKLFLNKIGQIFIKKLYNSQLTDYTTPILISPTRIYKMIKFSDLGFSCLVEAVLIPYRLGFRINEIPARCLARKEGKSKNSMKNIVAYLKAIIRIRLVKKNTLFKEN